MRRQGRSASGAWRLAAACLLAAAVAGVAAAPAEAYSLLGQRWPGTTIRYHNLAPSYAWSLQQAVQAWNTSGTRLRFVKSSRARAHIVVRAEGGGGGLCRGQATAGYVPKAYGGGWAMVSRACSRFDAAGVLAHELGHVLGLGHEDRRCATMNSTLWWRCPNSPQLGQYRCRLVNTDDVRGAVRRYGGRVRPQDPLYCWKYPPPPAPGEVSAVSNPASGADVLLRWRNTASPGLSTVGIARGRDACPTTLEGNPYWLEPASPGKVQTFEDFSSGPLPTGLYCYTLWSFDEANRTAGPTTVWVNHTDGFLPPSSLTAARISAPDAAVRLQWTSSANPRADLAWIMRKQGSCPTDPYDDDAVWLDQAPSGPPGAVRTWDETFDPGPGVWCYAIFSVDDDTGRYSSTAATDVLD